MRCYVETVMTKQGYVQVNMFQSGEGFVFGDGPPRCRVREEGGGWRRVVTEAACADGAGFRIQPGEGP